MVYMREKTMTAEPTTTTPAQANDGVSTILLALAGVLLCKSALAVVYLTEVALHIDVPMVTVGSIYWTVADFTVSALLLFAVIIYAINSIRGEN